MQTYILKAADTSSSDFTQWKFREDYIKADNLIEAKIKFQNRYPMWRLREIHGMPMKKYRDEVINCEHSYVVLHVIYKCTTCGNLSLNGGKEL